MRTTVTLADDVASAVEELRRRRGIGVSSAVNELVRQGLGRPTPPAPFVQATSAMRARIDVADVADALELLEGPRAR
ncbi:MAG: ribbon-helix-helix protein, CopG family [Acidimicrobiia bacterium]|nr:ribbon-helix-helix protein, CopG family [Acidimicrobiia bacterium]